MQRRPSEHCRGPRQDTEDAEGTHRIVNLLSALSSACFHDADIHHFRSDDATASSVQSVIDSISGAQGAIGVIGKALFTGATAPADARTQVQGNLTAAAGALSAISS